ncbi:MAG: hypothetical protein AB4050_04290 [Synechococcus sp.]
MRIDPAGRRKVEPLAVAKEFFQQQFADSTDQLKLPDEDVQRQLVAMGKMLEAGSDSGRNGLETESRLNSVPTSTDKTETGRTIDCRETLAERTLAEMCLRCYVSSAIEQVCVQLEGQFGLKHGFTRHDLFPFVLDADNPVRRSRHRDRVGYQSVTDSILRTYNPNRGSLSTWTVRLVRRNRELNSYLLECGVYLISDWAILNDTSTRQLCRILFEFHTLTETEIQDAAKLLEAYHSTYRHDRLIQRQTGRPGRCAQPTTEQLLRMAKYLHEYDNSREQVELQEQVERQQRYDRELRNETPMNEGRPSLLMEPPRLLAKLQWLAERLRQYRIHVRGGPSLATESLEGNAFRADAFLSSNGQGSEQQEEYGEFIEYFREQFSSCMDMAIASTIERWVTTLQRKKSQKHQQFLQALSLFHDRGMSMGDIAPLVGLKAQYQVSRLLKLKELRADIRQSLLLELRDRVKLEAERYHSDLRDLQEVDRQIEAALSEQVDDILQEAAAEASVAQKTVPTRSLYTRRLCQYLQTRSQES